MNYKYDSSRPYVARIDIFKVLHVVCISWTFLNPVFINIYNLLHGHMSLSYFYLLKIDEDRQDSARLAQAFFFLPEKKR